MNDSKNAQYAARSFNWIIRWFNFRRNSIFCSPASSVFYRFFTNEKLPTFMRAHTIFIENKHVIEKTEVKGIDEKNKVITIFSDPSILKKISNSKARLVIALPISVPKPPALSVEDESGVIEEFKTDTILNSLIGVGVEWKAAREIVDRVQYKLCKLDPQVSKPVIKKAIIEELENENSEAAKKFNKRRIWK